MKTWEFSLMIDDIKIILIAIERYKLRPKRIITNTKLKYCEMRIAYYIYENIDKKDITLKELDEEIHFNTCRIEFYLNRIRTILPAYIISHEEYEITFLNSLYNWMYCSHNNRRFYELDIDKVLGGK